MINEHVFRVRVNSKGIKQKYLFYLLYATEFHDILKILSKRAGQPSLNRPNIQDLMIPIPEDQDAIIKELDDYFYSMNAKILHADELRRNVQQILDKYLK